jgi:hypothetical protein
MYAVVSNNGTSTYNLSCIVCFKCFLIIGVYCISYKCFQRQKFIIGSCYSVHKTKKEKLVLCEKSVNSILLRSRYILYRDDELILSPIHMWLPPQPYRCYSLGCRFYGCR